MAALSFDCRTALPWRLVLLLLVLGALGAALLTPAQLTLKHHANDAAPVVRIGGVKQVLNTYVPSHPIQTSIRTLSSSTEIVELALPFRADRTRMQRQELSLSGPWDSTFGNERVQTSGAGSTLSFSSDANPLELAFMQRPDGGRVEVSWAQGSTIVDLKAARADWKVLQIPPVQLHSVITLNIPALIAGITINANPQSVEETRPHFDYAGRDLLLRQTLLPGQSLRVRIGLADLPALVAPVCLRFIGIALGAMALFFIPALLGVVILQAFQHNHEQPNVLIRFAVGFPALALTTNTLGHFFPTAAFAPSLLGGVLALAVVGGLIIRRRCHTAQSRANSATVPASVLIATFSGLFLSFWPMASMGPGYLGYLQTDSYFYTTVSDILRQEALLPLIAKGSIIGHGMRSIDLVLASALASFSGLSTARIWQVLSVMLCAIPPIAAYHWVRDWLKDDKTAIATAIVVAFWAPLASLYFEAYLAQYLLTPILYLNLYTASRLLEALKHTRTSPFSVALPFILSSSLAILLYPYFSVLPIAALGVMVWMLRKDRWRLLREGGTFLLSFAAAGNIGYYFLLGHAATGNFVQELNSIARFVVFPFYNQPKFLAFITGLTPFHGNAELFSQLQTLFPQDSVAESYFALNHHLLAFLEGPLVYWTVGAFAACWLVSIGLCRHHLRSETGLLLVTSMAGYLVLVRLAFLKSGLYAYCKLVWTCAALLPLWVVPLIACLGWGPPVAGVSAAAQTSYRRLGQFALALLLLGNLTSRTAAPALWLPNPENPYPWRTNNALASDLRNLEQWLQANAGHQGAAFAIADTRTSTGRLNQSQQVLSAHALSLLTGFGYNCINCRSSTELLDFIGYTPLPQYLASIDLLIMIGPPAPLPEGWQTAVRGQALSLLTRSR